LVVLTIEISIAATLDQGLYDGEWCNDCKSLLLDESWTFRKYPSV